MKEENLNQDESKFKSKFSFLEKLKMFTGNKKLDEETLNGILEQLNKDLQNKNVAHDVAVQICNNMRISLLNK